MTFNKQVRPGSGNGLTHLQSCHHGTILGQVDQNHLSLVDLVIVLVDDPDKGFVGIV